VLVFRRFLMNALEKYAAKKRLAGLLKTSGPSWSAVVRGGKAAYEGLKGLGKATMNLPQAVKDYRLARTAQKAGEGNYIPGLARGHRDVGTATYAKGSSGQEALAKMLRETGGRGVTSRTGSPTTQMDKLVTDVPASTMRRAQELSTVQSRGIPLDTPAGKAYAKYLKKDPTTSMFAPHKPLVNPRSRSAVKYPETESTRFKAYAGKPKGTRLNPPSGLISERHPYSPWIGQGFKQDAAGQIRQGLKLPAAAAVGTGAAAVGAKKYLNR